MLARSYDPHREAIDSLQPTIPAIFLQIARSNTLVSESVPGAASDAERGLLRRSPAISDLRNPTEEDCAKLRDAFPKDKELGKGDQKHRAELKAMLIKGSSSGELR